MALHLSPEIPTPSKLSLGNSWHSPWTKCSFQHLNNNNNKIGNSEYLRELKSLWYTHITGYYAAINRLYVHSIAWK